MDSYRHQNTTAYPQREEPPHPLSSSTDELVRRVEALDEELHKRLTREVAVLFTDIRGSSTFFKIHGDIAGRLMMQRHYDMLFPLIAQHQGTVVKTVGDSIMATFFDPRNAVSAAIAMQRTLSEYNVHQSTDDPIRIRIGINFGKGIIEQNDVYGNVVNIASKLVSVGESEQIVVSQSIWESLENQSEFVFSPLRTDTPFYSNLKLKAYAVRWREAEQMEEKEMTILSLAIIKRNSVSLQESAADGAQGDAPNFPSPIEQIVREKAFRTTINPLGGLQAVFEYAETAIETALDILRIFQQGGQAFHIGIHTGRIMVEEVEIIGGKEADEARERAGSHEIYLTQSTYAILKDNLLLHFLPLPVRLPNGTALHKLLVESSAKGTIEETRPADHALAHGECFYCSSTQHHPSTCPSKLIPYHTNSLNEMGYLSLPEMKAQFAKHFPTIVKPINPHQEDISVPLIGDQQYSSLKVPFEAFYEVNEVFQLRFLRKVWSTEAADWKNVTLAGAPRRMGGFLWLGEDSLRVGKHEESLIMFNKTLAHGAEDYKPHTGLGFLAIEQGDLIKASHHFQQALSCTVNPVQRSYVMLLLARIHELKGNYDDAADTVRQALMVAPHFLEAQYRHGVLLAKQGNTREALSIFRALIAAKPDYYPRVLIDPCLNDARQALDTLTKEIFDQAYDQASDNIRSIKRNLTDHQEWFSKEDYEYKTAEKILDQTVKLFEGNGYFGLLDVVSYGLDIKDKLRSALKNRRRSLRKNFSLLQGIGEAYERYLDSYSYKSLLSYADTLLLKRYNDALDKAQSASLIESAESLREAQQLIKELFSLSRKIGTNRKKLDFLKMTLFSSECFFKFFARFLLCTLTVSAVSCFILIGYEGYAHSLSSFSRETIADYVRFSSFCGMLFGAGAAVYWLYNNFDRLYAKLK